MSKSTDPRGSRRTPDSPDGNYTFPAGGGIDPARVGILDRILFFSYGVSPEVLAHATPKDVQRARTYGSLVLLVPLFAMLSMFYFASVVMTGSPTVPLTPTQQLACAGIALLWGVFVYQVDRSLLLSFAKSTRKGALVAIRLALVVGLGLIIAVPLELRVLESDINSLLVTDRAALIAERIPQATADIDARLTAKAAEIVQAEKAYESQLAFERTAIAAADAEATNIMRPGCGTICQKLQATAEAESAKTAAALETLDAERAALTDLQAEKTAAIAAVEAEAAHHDGLWMRWETAHRNFGSAMVFLALGFLMLELAPVLSKMASPRSLSDDLEAMREAEAYRRNGVETSPSLANEDAVHGRRFYGAELEAERLRREQEARLRDLDAEFAQRAASSPLDYETPLAGEESVAAEEASTGGSDAGSEDPTETEEAGESGDRAAQAAGDAALADDAELMKHLRESLDEVERLNHEPGDAVADDPERV